MIGEVQRLLDQRIQIDALALADRAAGMRQHAGDDAVGAAAMLGDLGQIAGHHLEDLVELGPAVVVEPGQCWRRGRLQIVQQLDRETGEIVDEV